ncbi:hypothetical protein BSZ39_08385 [Bowdeniella nasicola]|uniref:Peptidase S33 tripeptidyl aminopeptidase-like C-terminal domain-containing protein n=1 Tax=Bowdeniella nasicola TaxID=208480 RepID=A0A1Q5Q1B9_9ACTO|nr:alpha/beta hydrolase [Bowdeniella nasicola]OKL53664.1 hypothetical protein BSZ39_08385 [Bowdeniella nasicola]
MKTKIAAGLAASALLLSACSQTAQKTETSPSAEASTTAAPAPADTGAVPEGFEEFYTQQVEWKECGEKFRCAKVKVPIDYSDPTGETIEISVKQNVSAGESAPALFINPGGPGGSGVNQVGYADRLATEKLRGTYNVTGFDPRGVNESNPLKCLDDKAKDAMRAEDANLDTDEGYHRAVETLTKYGKACQENSGKLLGFVDTKSAARDMDVLRAVIGKASKLNYLGFSYGTFLGATYADLFPKNVGRFVLDGALDPSLSTFGVEKGQAVGFEKAARAYIADCQAGPNCPLKGDVEEGLKQLGRFFESLGTNPLPTADGDRKLTRSLGYMGVITPLYSQEAWPQLTLGLAQAMQERDGSILLMLADLMSERNDDGTYATNSEEAFGAINCLDYPVTGNKEQWAKEREELKKISPVFGPTLGGSELACSLWPHKSTAERKPITAAGSDPIVVIGTTGDPATPFEWSEALAKQLDNGHLLTYEGEGHTAYRPDNSCIADAVDNYLVDGKVPEAGARCS